MGVDRNAAALLLKARLDGARFGRTLTLGRQDLYLSLREYTRLLARVERPAPATLPAYADDLLLALGATKVEALDASDYQAAALVHDLNQPVPREWHERYDLILDGGTLEHVFDVRVAFENCMRMLKPGGHFLAVTPANNWCGHGFFQFSPEMFFRIFSEPNGFAIVEMYVSNGRGRDYYAVTDPVDVHMRVELCTREPMSLLVHARRERSGEIFAAAPQQSDYVAGWAAAVASPETAIRPPQAPWKTLPLIRQVLGWRRGFNYYRHRSVANRAFFRPVDLRF